MQKEINDVEEILERVCRLPELKPLLKGGKRLRPALVLLSSLFGRGPCPDVTRLAVAVEILHLSSLVHDDIIDCSLNRRGKPTINQLFGDQSAVLVGDYLYFLFLEQAAELGEYVLTSLSGALKDMIRAEFDQQRELFNYEVYEKKYFKRSAQKAGTFLSCCCKLGAMLAGAPPKALCSLEKFGLFLGISFQIKDDLLDYQGNPAATGKPVSNDINRGVFTLPLIHALKNSPNKNILRGLIGSSKLPLSTLEYIINDMRETGSLDYAAGMAKRYALLAERALSSLPANPARDSFYSLVEFVTKRDF
ncbi:MAG: polyprenyl synthetase family protein [Desulfotomaculaceae bacterium]|nr:polyprenyl synthetase family protein [Desulfotomaculaceae bacterium]MDD4766634.1 polyprenyl synthetase family protein [Desulfotomaculaceae bacterium]